MENAMPADPNSLPKPAILPADFDQHQDDIPAEAGGNNPTEDDILDNPESAVSQIPVGGRDEPDVRPLRGNYSPKARWRS
jgi:hypothetical protein